MIRLLSIIIVVLLFGYIIHVADLDLLYRLLTDLDAGVLVPVLAAYFVFLATKALRLQALIRNGTSSGFYGLFHLAVDHNLYLSYMPFRMGDVLFADIAKRHAGLQADTAVAALVCVRLFDVAILLLFLVLALSMLGDMAISIPQAIVALIVLTGIVLMGLRASQLLVSLRSVLSAVLSMRWREDVSAFLARLSQRFAEFVSIRSYLSGLTFTLAGWSVLTVIYALLLGSLGIMDPWVTSLILLAVLNLAMLLPIQTVAGLGVADSAIAYGLVLTGMEISVAASVALSIRLMMLALPVVSASVFYLFHYAIGRRYGRC